MHRYKYDLHVHTTEVSRCGKVEAVNVVKLYKEAGYTGIVITDHYFKDYFEELKCNTWEEKVDAYLSGYKKAFAEGEKLGLKVLLGIELRFEENENDYLVYGIDEEFLKNNKELYKLGIEKFRKFMEGKNIIIFQAHPYRNEIRPVSPALLDGIEVFNGNPRSNSKNHLAYAYAKDNNMRMISGSDFHQPQDLAGGGIILSEIINTSKELMQILKEDRIVELIPENYISVGDIIYNALKNQ